MAELWETLTIGLILSLLFIGVSYFFWRRYDRPTPLMIEREEEKQRLKVERNTWRQVEAKMEAERLEADSKAQYVQRKAEKLARAAPPADEHVADAWNTLGLDAPKATSKASTFEAEKMDANALQKASIHGGLGEEEANDDDVLSVDELVKVRQDQGVIASTEEPEWDIIEKIAEIAGKDDHEVPEVPEAPDLPSVDEILAATLDAPSSAEESELETEEPGPQGELGPGEGQETTPRHPTDSADDLTLDSPPKSEPWSGEEWSEELA